MPMSHRDLWVKIKRETKGKAPAEEVAVLREYLADWPAFKGPYQELGKKLARRVEELEKILSVRGAHEVRDDPFSVRKRGLAQVGLVGLPNVGKSTLFEALTGAEVETADYPYTTLLPNVGMMPIGAYEFEIVDLPPLSEGPISELSYASGLKEAVSNAGLLVVVVDLSGDPEKELSVTCERLDELEVRAVWRAGGETGIGSTGRAKPALLFGTHVDRAGVDALEYLRSMVPSATLFAHPLGPGERAAVGEALSGLVGRIVVKARNPAEPDEPLDYAVPVGATVGDLAAAIHRELASKARRARVWGPSAVHEGQEVGLDHVLEGGDTVEIIER